MVRNLFRRNWLLLAAALVGVIALGLAAASPVRAQSTLIWTNGTGDFNQPANWDPAQAPADSDTAQFTNGTSYTVSFATNSPLISTATFEGFAGVVTLNMGTSSFMLTNQFQIGIGAGTTSVAIASGTLAVTNQGLAQIRIGESSNNLGILTVTNGVVMADGISIGPTATGHGQLIISASGVVTSSAAGDVGTITVGATASTAPSQLIITNGGKLFVQGETRIGGSGTSNNLALISGPTSIWTNKLNGVRVGSGGSSGNLLIISNGAKLFMANPGTIGGNGAGVNCNTAIVTGVGSIWESDPGNSFTIGPNTAGSSNNVLYVYDGGSLICGGTLTIGNAALSTQNSFNMGGPGASSIGNAVDLRFPSASVANFATFTNSVFNVGLLQIFGGSSNIVSILPGATLIISNSVALYSGTSATNVNLTMSGTGNSLLITGGTLIDVSGSNSATFAFGMTCGGTNQVVISSGGRLLTETGTFGTSALFTGIVTGVGSVWSNSGPFIIFGNNTSGYSNYLAVVSGGSFFNAGSLNIGNSSTANVNTVVLGGDGASSTFVNLGSLNLGSAAGSYGNTLTVSNVVVNIGTLNVGVDGSTNNIFTLLGGSTTSFSFMRVRPTNTVIFAAGTINAGAATVDSLASPNNAPFVVGDGVSAARYNMAAGGSGFHNFSDGGLVVTNNATVTGCGTINGNVVVDPGGTVMADCGATLYFNSTVTNYGNIVATGGTVLTFYGPVVNTGLIDASDGDVQFFAGVSGNGSILTSSTNSWTGGSEKWEASTNWSHGTAPSITDDADLITNVGNNTVTIDANTAGGFPNSLTISNLAISAPLGSTNTLYLSNVGPVINVLVNPGFEADAVSNDISCNGVTPITGWSLGGETTYSNVDSGGPASPSACYPVHGGIGALAEAAEESPPVVYQSLAVTPGQVWSMTGYGYICQTICHITPSSDFRGLLKIVWYDGNGNPIAPLEDGNLIGGVDAAPYYGITSAPQLTNASAPDTWTFLQCQGTVPAGCVTGLFFNITVGSAGVCLFDDDSASLVTKTPLDILNSLTISNNGMVVVTNSILRVDSLSGGALSIDGEVAVCDGGSVIATNNNTYVGYNGAGQMTVSNGTVLAGNVYVALNAGSQGTLTLAGGTIVAQSPNFILGELPSAVGTVWINGGEMDVANNLLGETVVGDLGFGALTLSNGTVRTCNLIVGRSAGTGVVNINGGAMLVTNCSGVTEIRNGTITLNGGELATESLILTNAGGSLTFDGGLLICQSSIVSNGQAFTIGSNSMFQANGGVQSFADGLAIQTNSVGSGTLSGSGTITGNIVNHGNVQATGGTTLNFTGSVANNGNFVATGGTVLKFYGPVVNTGLIDGSGGDVQFFSGVSGSGVILTPTNSWTGSSDKWEASTNWSHGTAPSITDDADLITNAGNNTVTIDATTAGGFPGTMAIRNLTMAGVGSSINTLALTNAGLGTPLHILDTLALSNNSVVVVNNSALQVDEALSVGVAPGSGNLLIITNGGQLVSTLTAIGGLSGFGSVSNSVLVTGPGSVWINTNDNLVIQNSAPGVAMVVANGGQFVGGGVFIGYNGTASSNTVIVTDPGSSWTNVSFALSIGGNSYGDQFIVSNGASVFTDNAIIGNPAGHNHSAVVTGSNSLWKIDGEIQIGYGNNGDSLTVADGGSLIASNATHSAEVLVNGATLFLGDGTFQADNLVVTNGGAIQYTETYQVENANVTVASGSDVQAASNFVVASSATSTSSVAVTTGGAVTATNGAVSVGNDGTVTSGGGVGTMTVNGTLTTSAILLGSSAGGQGDMILGDGGQINCAGTNCLLVCNDFGQIGGNLGWTNIGSAMYCGYAHPGAYILSNGTSSCQDVYVGYDNAGTMTIAGGSMSILSRLLVGQLGSPLATGAVWITGGQLAIANYSIIGNSGIGQVSISNGTVTAADVFIGNSGNPGTLTLAGGSLTVNGIVVPNPGSQFIFSSGHLNAVAVTNANGQLLTVGNSVSPATLNLLGGISSLNNGLKISANALLMGSGTIPGSVANFGVIAPGGGNLNFTGLVTNNGLILTNSTIHFTGGLVNNGRVLDAAGDADGDGMNNLWEVLAGTNPTNSASFLHITAMTRIGSDVQVSWSTVGGKSYVVQASTGVGGNYLSSFTDISPVISVPGSGESTTNYLDPGGATYIPSRYYRVRLGP